MIKMNDYDLYALADALAEPYALDKNYANKLKIPYALIIGSREIESGKLSLKDLGSGKEYSLSLEKIIKKLSV